MFDYQAGEKYRLTLIVVGIAGFIMGIGFTAFLIPEPHAQAHARRPRPKWADNPDVTGVASGGPRRSGTPERPDDSAAAQQQAPEPYRHTDSASAKKLIEDWLPIAWDLSAGSAQASQKKAMLYMTPDCASNYRANIWTPELASQIEQAGLRSSFAATSISVGGTNSDGAVVIVVEGEHVLTVPDKGERRRQVRVEYLVKDTDQGLRICGISEGRPPGEV